MHVTIDGYGGDPQKLADENLVRAFLDLCPSAIGMTKIAPPYVCRYVGAKPEDWGVSGFVLIAESHISRAHLPRPRLRLGRRVLLQELSTQTLPSRIFASASISASVRVHSLPRGLEFPHDVAAATPLATSERYRVAESLPSSRAEAAHPLLPS